MTSLRKLLAESYAAPIAIAILMARTIIGMIDGLALPVGYGILSTVAFVMNAVTERELPYIPHGLDGADLLLFFKSISKIEEAATCAVASWLLSQLVYGRGPIRCLRATWSEMRGG